MKYLFLLAVFFSVLGCGTNRLSDFNTVADVDDFSLKSYERGLREYYARLNSNKIKNEGIEIFFRGKVYRYPDFIKKHELDKLNNKLVGLRIVKDSAEISTYRSDAKVLIVID